MDTSERRVNVRVTGEELAISYSYNALYIVTLSHPFSSRAVALAIIKGPRWERALRNTTDAAWGGTTTPLRKLIRKMPEVAEEVFNRCTVTNATKDGKVIVL